MKISCKYCHKRFTKKRNERFCSKECKQKHTKEYNRTYYVTGGNYKECELYIECPVCEKKHVPGFMDDELFTGRKYCSKECAALMKKARDMLRYESEYYKKIHRKSSKKSYYKRKKKLKDK